MFHNVDILLLAAAFHDVEIICNDYSGFKA